MEQVFFIADFHLGDHDVFTKDENGRRMNVNVAMRDNWLLDMWMSQVGKKDCVYILGDLMAYRGETGENLLSRLPGEKYLIEGNHDENLRAFPGQFRSVELMMNKVFSDGLSIPQGKTECDDVSLSDVFVVQEAGRCRLASWTFTWQSR